MNRITTKPQRKTVLRAAAVVGAAVLGLTATACGRSDDDSSKVAEASSPAASVSGSQEPDTEPSPSTDEPSASPSASEEASAEASPSGSAATAPLVLSQDEEKPKAKDADLRPAKVVLSEFTTVDRITWQQWTDSRATGSGEVTGTWCIETCQEKPLKGTVTLSDPKTVNGKRYFSAYTLKLADGTKKTYDTDELDGKRQLATP